MNFDKNKYYLGELCVRNHNWNNSGKTLRKIKNSVCNKCCAEKKSEKLYGRSFRLTKIRTKENIAQEIIKLYFLGFPLNDNYVSKNHTSLYSAARKRRHFGSWRKALEYSGFDYNQILSLHEYISHDGKTYDSIEECRCANYLFLLKNKNIIMGYESHVRICLERNWTCDFVVEKNNKEKLFLEYNGCQKLRNNYARSKSIHEQKINYYKDNMFNFFECFSLNEVFLLFSFIPKNEEIDFISQVKGVKIEEFKNNILNDYIQKCKLYNKILSRNEYTNVGICNGATLANHFKSFSNVKKIAKEKINYVI